MPKTKVLPLPSDDVPIWDALVAELGDPRPYEPTVAEFTVVEQPNEPLVDDAGFDDALTALDDDVADARVDLDYDEAYGLALLYITEDAFRARHGLPDLLSRVARPPATPSVDERLVALLDQTVVIPVLRPGERTVRLDPNGFPTEEQP